MSNQVDNCCNKCNDKREGCPYPNIVGTGEVTVVKNGCDFEVNAPFNPTVVSTDDTVGVTKSRNENGSTQYDLHVECCDNKVGACPEDPRPGALSEKIRVRAPLKKNVSNCESDGYYEIYIDETEIPDEKVAVDSGCRPVYLEDALVAGEGVRIRKDRCRLIVGLDDKLDESIYVKPTIKLMLTSDVRLVVNTEFQADDQYVGFRLLPLNTYVDNNGSGRSDRISQGTLNAMGETTMSAVIPKSGWYDIDFGMNGGTNFGTNALRGMIMSDMYNKEVILDIKPIGVPAGRAINQLADDPDGPSDLQQFECHGGTKTYLKEGTNVVLGFRIDPYVDIDHPDNSTDAIVYIRRAGLAGGYLGSGTTLDNSEAGCYLNVTRDTDANGLTLYK